MWTPGASPPTSRGPPPRPPSLPPPPSFLLSLLATPLSPEDELVPGRRARRDGDLLPAGERGHLDLAPESRLREGDRHLAEQVRPLPREERVVPHRDHDVEVSV